jgi:tetratricopeptide (TPR) repeat protein
MILKSVKICLGLLCLVFTAKAQDPLDQYIDRLRRSEASGGSETSFLSVGSTFLYGQGYFDKKEYDLAAMYFKQAWEKDSTNAFVNYQIAASLLKQNNKYKAEEAKTYMQKAIELNSGLAARFASDFPSQAQAKPAKAEGQAKAAGLNKYIEELKYSQATGGSKTAMLSPGLDVMYGYEYYQKGEYEFAAMRFRQAVTKDPEDVYANYLLGVSLTAQGEKAAAKLYLDKAFAGDATLEKKFAGDAATATAQFNKQKAAKEPTPASSTKPVVGGKLAYGNYNCTETIWNGPNTSPAYRYERKGYFELKSDGTYRWLDNGTTGKYSYDEKTGTIKWISGYLANMKAKASQFQPGVNVAQITVNFSNSYRWECGCNKK